jgi:hypothetical protein
LAAGAGRDSRKRAELGLPPIEQVVADLATQLTADEDRPAAFQALLGSRLRTLVECHRHRREPGMRAAWRACLIEAASICVLLAGRLPPPRHSGPPGAQTPNASPQPLLIRTPLLIASPSKSRTIKALGATLAVVAAMATPAAAQGPTFGFDFNPTVDKIRVTSAVLEGTTVKLKAEASASASPTA